MQGYLTGKVQSLQTNDSVRLVQSCLGSDLEVSASVGLLMVCCITAQHDPDRTVLSHWCNREDCMLS